MADKKAENDSFKRKLLRGWLKFAHVLERVTAPIRKVLGITVMSLIYLLVIPFWSVFMVWKDPLRKKLDPDADSYYERHDPVEDTIERLSHSS